MDQVQVLDHAVESQRDFDRIEILALDVLDERDLQELVGRDVADDARYGLQPGQAAGLEPALTDDERVAVAGRAHQDWLEDPVRADGSGELPQGLGIEVDAGLDRIGGRSWLSESR